jgi:mannose-6-phosphate isomerase-like protein (cupin superfamily)
MRAVLLLVLICATVPLRAADPSVPVHWSAAQIAGIETRIAGSVDPARHLGIERLLDSATLIYRDGPSEAEVHRTLADFITVRSGGGEVVVGGTIVDARSESVNELRGRAIQGGTRYTLAAGDMLYIPANTVHQFFVAPGTRFTITIVKITPKGD